MKNNKNILLAVISGIVACIVCVGIVILFPKDNELKGGEEPILGDVCGTSYGSWQEGSWGAWTCSPGGLTTSAPTIATSGTSYTQYENIDNTQGCYMNDNSLGTTCSSCHREKKWTRTASYGCTSCSPGKYLDGDQCKTCPNGQFSTDGDVCWSCPSGYESTDINGDIGATDESECYKTVLPGRYIPVANGTVELCPVGSYNDTSKKVYFGQTSTCTSCGNGLTTEGTGSTNSTQCIAVASPSPTITPSFACTYCMGTCMDSNTQEYCTGVCAEECAVASPSPTEFNCQGLSQSECNSGAATSYCGWCQGGCKAKSVCDAIPSPSPTATVSPTPTITDLGICNNGATLYQYSSCTVPSGKKCNVNGGSYYTEGQYIVSNATGEVHIACVDLNAPTATATTSPSPTATTTTTTSPSPTGTTVPCANITGSSSCVARSDCEFDYTNGCHNKPQTCSGANTYWNGTECVTCPSGFQATATIPTCHFYVPAGSYYNPSQGSSVISTCPVNTYSTGGIYYASGNTNATALTTCTPCPSGYTSPMGSKSKSACVASTGTCTLTVTTTANKVSPVTSSCPSDNRYPDTWTVTVKAVGDGCNGGTLEMSARGAERQGTSGNHSISNGQTFNILYQSTTCCSTSTVTAKVTKNNTTIAQDSVSVETSSGWKLTQHSTDEQPVCVSVSEYNSNPHSAKEADDQSKDIYYIALNNTHCSGQREVDIYRRGCGTSGGTSTKYNFCCAKDDGSSYTWYTNQSSMKCPSGYTVDNNKNENTCKTVTVPACYIDSEKNYHWTDNPSSSWQIVSGVSREEDCKEVETPACYVDNSGNYKWGTYAKTSGYTKVVAIETEALCHKPEVNEACYKNADNDYIWTSSAPTGYTVVEGVTKPEDCNYENPACYVHGNEFVWGKYANVNGYIILENIESEAQCKVPTNEACYKDKNGNYAWGEYSNDEGYTLVPEAKTMSQCSPDVPTPSTGLDTSKVVYIFMAILMAFGIGFIYYSSIMKKEN